jgi:hypothetical protein
LEVRAYSLQEGVPARTTLVDGQGGRWGEVVVTKKGSSLLVAAPAPALPLTLKVEGKTIRIDKTTQTV